MPEINNDIYEELSDRWWSGDSFLSSLHALNPGRFSYLQRILEKQAITPTGKTALEVGCGGGFATERLARMGFDTSGIDPSSGSIAAASRHAKDCGLDIDYRTGPGEKLPWPDNSFDLVFCCDVLEHVNSVETVVAEISRVLKPGGIFFFDTINRTAFSWLFFIKIAQDIPFTRIMPRNTHVWSMFIKPAELKKAINSSGMRCEEITGLAPSLNPASIMRGINAQRKRVHPEELGKAIGMGSSRIKAGAYMGWASL